MKTETENVIYLIFAVDFSQANHCGVLESSVGFSKAREGSHFCFSSLKNFEKRTQWKCIWRFVCFEQQNANFQQ